MAITAIKNRTCNFFATLALRLTGVAMRVGQIANKMKFEKAREI